MTPTEIRSARLALGLTQKDFGILLHATDRTVRMWESGQRNMTQATAELLKIKNKEIKMETATIREGDQFVGRFDVKNAPNEFIRKLVIEALENGWAAAKDEEGCEVTAVAVSE